MNLITIKTFDNTVDAHILKARLENEAIVCYLFDENIVSINPLYNITVGGIKLKINEIDKSKALEIITEIENTPSTNEKDEKISCPKCNSSNVFLNHRSINGLGAIISVISSFLLTIFPFYFKTIYKCKDCGKEFK